MVQCSDFIYCFMVLDFLISASNHSVSLYLNLNSLNYLAKNFDTLLPTSLIFVWMEQKLV